MVDDKLGNFEMVFSANLRRNLMVLLKYCDIGKGGHIEREGGEWPTFFDWMNLVSSCNKSLTSLKKLGSYNF